MILFSNIPKSKGKRDEKKRPSAIHAAQCLGQKAANLNKEAISFIYYLDVRSPH